MKRHLTALAACILALASCKSTPVFRNELPPIFPDYVGVTIPAGTAPLNFCLPEGYAQCFVKVRDSEGRSIQARGGYAGFNLKEWHRLTEQNIGKDLRVSVCGKMGKVWVQFQDFTIHVSEHPLDAWGVVYRKIAPGYETYSKIGNYQRDIHNWSEKPIIESTLTPGQCVNCHTANATDPKEFTFHLRGKHGATYFQTPQGHKWVTTKTEATISNAVYPYWHPSGRYCACSNNSIHQGFWTGADRLIEVWDTESDISIVDVTTDQVIVSPLVHTEDFETYPAFSPDGKTVYYCSCKPYPIPAEVDKLRYDLCSIDFDPEAGSFGTAVDTLIKASAQGKSITFPRPSYDGRFILYSLADYGCFPIDHKESDLWLLDLESGESHPLTAANSDCAESFHNWSADSRWILFSSRRLDGLYSNLFICCIDEDGNAAKPFLLPQKNPWKYYHGTLFSFNVPDFTKHEVKFDTRRTFREVFSGERVQATSK